MGLLPMALPSEASEVFTCSASAVTEIVSVMVPTSSLMVMVAGVFTSSWIRSMD